MPPALVGREAELSRLRSALEASASAQGRLVVLAGEPGVGKTRLAREVLTEAEQRGCARLVGRTLEQFATVPLFVVSELLHEAARVASPSLRAQAAARWPELAHLLPDGSGQPQPALEGGQLRIYRSIVAFLKLLAREQPLAVLLEDLHWADSASIGALLYLARHIHDAPLLVLVTYRDTELTPQLDDALRELAREPFAAEITLRGLAPAATALLVRAHQHVEPDDFVRLVHARSGGNPFYIEEILKARELAPGADLEVPRSIRSMVAQRVRGIDPAAQETLRLASVLGHEFTLGALQQAAEQSEADVLGHLEAALARRLIVEQRSRGLDQYAFAHALVQQALYAEVPSHRLRRLHLRVAQVLVAHHARRPDGAAELARHFILAGATPQALEHSLIAAEYAARRFAHAEAAEHFAAAVQLALESNDERLAAELRQKLGWALLDAGRGSEALSALDEAQATYQRLAEPLAQARAQFQRARIYHLSFDYRAAAPPIEEALRLWPAEERSTAEYAAVLLDAARIKTFTADQESARDFAGRGLALCEQLGDPGLLARALCEFELVRERDGASFDETLPLFERAERLARAAREWRFLGRVYMNRGNRKEALGDLRGSRADREQAVAAWDHGGVAWSVAWGGFVLATLCMALGDWQAAREALARTRENQPRFAGLDVLTAWLDGAHRRALDLAPGYVEDARRRDDVQNVQLGHIFRADFALQLGERGLAEMAAREAVECPRIGIVEAMWAAATLAEAAVLTDAPDAEQILDATNALADEPDTDSHRPQLLRVQALHLRARGDTSAALQRLQASAEIGRAQGALVQVARTLAVLSDIAHELRQVDLARAVDTERVTIVRRIGPATHGLNWATPLARSTDSSDPLTAREREVAALVARGLSNRQIADRLVITERTVAAHVEHVHAKLGFTSRTQIAVWASTRLAEPPIAVKIGGPADVHERDRP